MGKRIIRETRRNFKGVWIPKEYYLDSNLSITEVVLIVEIDSLDSGQGIYASNKHFAEFLGLSKGRISQMISGLEKKGYLNIQYYVDENLEKHRYIHLVKNSNWVKDPKEPYLENAKRGVKNTNSGIKDPKEPYLENAECKNTHRRIQKKNTYEGELQSKAIKEIVGYLNTKANTHYKATSQATKQYINARLNERFTVDDFKTVINNKVAQWLNDPKMSRYLRPKTLFGPNFESYLNERINVGSDQNSNNGRTINQHPDSYYTHVVDGRWTQSQIDQAYSGDPYYTQIIDGKHTQYVLDVMNGKRKALGD